MLRVLLANEPHTLSDELRRDIESAAGVEIVGQANSPSTTLMMAGELCADLVLIPAHDDGVPGLCSHLFLQVPDVVVVEIAADGESAVVYRSMVSAEKMDRLSSDGLVAVFDRLRAT